ncbi:orotate phosphoribosyltransferase [Starmerella bacillaris]|uniref:orotate phosphoribosyltransferase n=1 Tax=Starmerella bacillaris TaxID=1247836 RepID=A0AAV5RGC1_STABA|nr:orotate phosphoribosyltransferase [Starmerella bacillaris]
MSQKSLFIKHAVDSEALLFGKFTLKSGRESPYFFNLGKFCAGGALSALATAYAETILNDKIEFDVLFGPAYKGISLAALTIAKIAELRPELSHLSYAYNRKEVKDHGEGGSLVGADLKGRKVLIIDDVITAGTAANEAISIIEHAQGNVVGMVVAVNRQEKLPGSSLDALHKITEDKNIRALSIVDFSDIIDYMKPSLSSEQLSAMNAYKEKYC